jgi:hypothetical protein
MKKIVNVERGGFLHPEGVYDDPKGGILRAAIYPRLRDHYQFINELNLFLEVDHHAKYGVNVFACAGSNGALFHHASNLWLMSGNWWGA